MCLYHVSWGVPGYVDLLISYDIELHRYIGSLYNTSCYSAMFIIYVLSGYVHILLCICVYGSNYVIIIPAIFINWRPFSMDTPHHRYKYYNLGNLQIKIGATNAHFAWV